jgi:hypothetical protein
MCSKRADRRENLTSEDCWLADLRLSPSMCVVLLNISARRDFDYGLVSGNMGLTIAALHRRRLIGENGLSEEGEKAATLIKALRKKR